MKAVTIDQFGGREVLKIANVPTPLPKDNEVQIKLHYAGVNPIDWKTREGWLAKRGIIHHFPLILGKEGSGVIASIGSKVKNWKIGDEVMVYYKPETLQFGTYAEYICCDASTIAKKPKNISLKQAAIIPLVGLTSWQALFDVGQLLAGETVLIERGAGGIGSLAIQLAKQACATILTTASPKNHDYVKSLGADFVIDYTKNDTVNQIKKICQKGVHLLLDSVGQETLRQNIKGVQKGGRIVSLLEQLSEEEAKQYDIKAFYHSCYPSGAQLEHLSSMIEDDLLQVPPIQEFSLEDVKLAHEELETNHTLGKIVLNIS